LKDSSLDLIGFVLTQTKVILALMQIRLNQD